MIRNGYVTRIEPFFNELTKKIPFFQTPKKKKDEASA